MNLGEKQELTAVKKVEFGMYLAENPEDETRVLLPAKQVPEGLCIGDKVEIFLYLYIPVRGSWNWRGLFEGACTGMVFGILADCGRTAAGSWRKNNSKDLAI